MKPSILCIQFRKNPELVNHEQCCIEREIGGFASLTFISALEIEHAWPDPEQLLARTHGVIFGGSGDFDFDGGREEADEARMMSYVLLKQLNPLLAYIFAHDFPTLGICYGHQLIGVYRGAKIRADPAQKKMRSHSLTISDSSTDEQVLTGVPASFFAQYGHKDSLMELPEGAALIAHGGDACRCAALRYRTNIITTQFHPELSHEDLSQRLTSSTGYLPDGACIDEMVQPSPHATRILHNFAKLVAHTL